MAVWRCRHKTYSGHLYFNRFVVMWKPTHKLLSSAEWWRWLTFSFIDSLAEMWWKKGVFGAGLSENLVHILQPMSSFCPWYPAVFIGNNISTFTPLLLKLSNLDFLSVSDSHVFTVSSIKCNQHLDFVSSENPDFQSALLESVNKTH